MIHLIVLPNPDTVVCRPAYSGRYQHTCVTIKCLVPVNNAFEKSNISFTSRKSDRPAILACEPDDNDTLVYQEKKVEQLWGKFFSDPSQWWDHRWEKGNARYPDFKHKETQEALWLNGKLKPSWVDAELAAMAPGTVECNIFPWNVKLAGYVKAGQYKEAIDFFQQLLRNGMKPDKYTFVPLLNACASLRALEQGRHVHIHIIQNGCEADVFVGGGLVDMYTKCGSIEDAWMVFNKMPARDVVAWNAMILGYVKCGQGQKALELCQKMQLEQVEPDQFTFVVFLNTCASVGALDEGRRVHELIVQKGHESDLFVGNSLVDMYAKCGSMEDAFKVFKNMSKHDEVSWNSLILGYVKCGKGQTALKVFQQMQTEIQPVCATFLAALNACASVGALKEGKCIHEQIIQRDLESDIFLGNCLVDMYAKCGSIEDAWRMFNKMPTRDVFGWSAMILGYEKLGEGWKALELYKQMQLEGVEPDDVTFVAVLNACASTGALEEGRLVHEQVLKRGRESNVCVGSSLVDMYAKCGSAVDAFNVFKDMPTSNVVCWNAMINGYVKCGEGQKAMEVSRLMQREGVVPDRGTFMGILNACASLVALEDGRRAHEQIIQTGCDSDLFVGNSLIDMYAKCGSIDEAQRVFYKMPTRNVVSWNTLILGLVKHGQGQKSLELSRQMKMEGVEPDRVTFIGMLNACASTAALEDGRIVHADIIETGWESDIFVSNSLIDMYANCGSIEDAQQLFYKMTTRDAVTWNTMLGGYARHGHGKQAVGHFAHMSQQGVEIDFVTFISLLSACSHSGLVDEGLHYFESMIPVYNVRTANEHSACMVDLLSRAGHLQEAEDFIQTLSIEPNVSVWMSLLSGCRVHFNVEMAERISKQILQLDPGNAPVHVLLSNIYAACGKWESCENIQHLRRGRAAK